MGRRVAYAEIGALVAKREGRRKAYSVNAVSAWVNGDAEPSIAGLSALAGVLGVNAAWLAFGEGDSRVGESSHMARVAESAPPAYPAKDLTAATATAGRRASPKTGRGK